MFMPQEKTDFILPLCGFGVVVILCKKIKLDAEAILYKKG